MKSKKPKILYICNSNYSNKNFYKFLQKNYSVKRCYNVLPNCIEEYFGKFNFSESDKYEDNNWEVALRHHNSNEDIIYKFGIDLGHLLDLGYNVEDKLFYFKRAFNRYLTQLGFDVPEDKIISEILRSTKKSNNFIKESEMKNYELIIIDNIINFIGEDSSIRTLENGKKDFPHTQYKVTPEILHKSLRSNQKLLLFLNLDMNLLDSEDFIHLNSVFDRINLSRVELSGEIDDEEDLDALTLQGIDSDSKLGEDIGEFHINVNNLKSGKHKFLYNGVNTVHILYPIQLVPYNKDKIKDRSKILLTGNRDSTKIIWGNSTNHNYVNYSRLYPYENNNSKEHQTIFGVLDMDNRNIYSMLSGSLNFSDCFDDKKSDNKIFIQNIIDCLLNQSDVESFVDDNTLPKIILSIEPRYLRINSKEITLSKTEFCYYLYFLQRAKDELEFTDVKKESNTEFNKHESIIDKQFNPSVSSDVIIEIIEIYNKVYPGDESNIKLKNKFYLDKTTPEIKPTLTSIISRINTAIKKKLKNTSEEKFIEHVTITKGQTKFLYGINIPSTQITIG